MFGSVVPLQVGDPRLSATEDRSRKSCAVDVRDLCQPREPDRERRKGRNCKSGALERSAAHDLRR